MRFDRFRLEKGDSTRRMGTPRGILCLLSIVEQKITFQMITNMLGSDDY